MIISHEQFELVAAYLRAAPAQPAEAAGTSVTLTAELSERVRSSVDSAPEVRKERVEEARRHLEQGGFSSSDVAEKMIARALSDKLR